MKLSLNEMKKFNYTGVRSTYTVVERLGQGGQGNVFKCNDLENNFLKGKPLDDDCTLLIVDIKN